MEPLRERHSKTLEALSAFALLVLADGRLIEADVPRPDLLHCTLDQLRTDPFRDTFPRQLRRSIDGAMKVALQSERPARFEYTLEAADGVEREYDATIRRVSDDLLIIVRDASRDTHAARHVVDAVTHEQRRIARDLHDGLGSHLTAMAMLVSGLSKEARDGRPVEPEALEDVTALINESIEQTRELIRGIGQFRTLNLAEALQTLAERFHTRFHIPVFFFQEGVLPRLTKEETNQLFRIGQECVQNAVKHAHASRVDIRLRTEGATLELVVEDDGVGMPDSHGDASGLGLNIIRYRARAVRATCTFERAPGGGTLVRCVLMRPDREASSSARFPRKGGTRRPTRR